MFDLPKGFVIQELQKNSPEANAAIAVAIKHDLPYQFTSAYSFHEDHLVIGSVEYLREWFKENKIKEPVISDYPRELEPWRNRIIKKKLLKDLTEEDKFFKPVQTKLFEANTIPDNADPMTLVWVSEYVDWIAEFRVYVIDGCIVGIAQYGDEDDLDYQPYTDTIKEMIASYSSSPVAYAMDIGITKDGRVDLVEINDAWATGRYQWGIGSEDYIMWLWTRWKQIKSDPYVEPVSPGNPS